MVTKKSYRSKLHILESHVRIGRGYCFIFYLFILLTTSITSEKQQWMPKA